MNAIEISSGPVGPRREGTSPGIPVPGCLVSFHLFPQLNSLPPLAHGDVNFFHCTEKDVVFPLVRFSFSWVRRHLWVSQGYIRKPSGFAKKLLVSRIPTPGVIICSSRRCSVPSPPVTWRVTHNQAVADITNRGRSCSKAIVSSK